MSGPSNLAMPTEITDRFTALAETVGQTHRALGRIVDEYVSELPHGYAMQAYELFADLYHQVTGETISPRTIRAWRDSVSSYSKQELRDFESLSDSQLVEAVKLSEVANMPAADICRWAVENAVSSVPAMRANWLPTTSTEYAVDIPAISGLIRYANHNLPDEKRPRFDELLAELRALFTA